MTDETTTETRSRVDLGSALTSCLIEWEKMEREAIAKSRYLTTFEYRKKDQFTLKIDRPFRHWGSRNLVFLKFTSMQPTSRTQNFFSADKQVFEKLKAQDLLPRSVVRYLFTQNQHFLKITEKDNYNFNVFPERGEIILYEAENKVGDAYPMSAGVAYQAWSHIEGLKQVTFPTTPISEKTRNLFLGQLEREEPNGLEIVPSDEYEWDDSQLAVFQRFNEGSPFLLLNCPAGTSKTTLMIEICNRLVENPSVKILVISHDHSVVDLLESKLAHVDPSIVIYRIGEREKARRSNFYFKQKVPGFYENAVNDLQDATHNTRNIPEKHRNQRMQLLVEWTDFLASDSGLSLFQKLAFNSANVIFGTVEGITYYKKRGMLDPFLPFDVVLVDEASKITFPMFLNAQLYGKRWLLAGDEDLLQPFIRKELTGRKKYPSILETLGDRFDPIEDKYGLSLSTQYRTRPEIVETFNQHLYERPLRVVENPRYGYFEFSAHTPRGWQGKPILFMNTDKLQALAVDQGNGINKCERDLIEDYLQIIEDPKNWHPDYQNAQVGSKIEVFVTSTNGRQVDAFRDNLRLKLDHVNLEINTVHEVMGKGADVILWSLAYAPKSLLKDQLRNSRHLWNKKKVPDIPYFLRDARKIYSLLTRLRGKLIIVGSHTVYLELKKALKSASNHFAKKIAQVLEDFDPLMTILDEKPMGR